MLGNFTQPYKKIYVGSVPIQLPITGYEYPVENWTLFRVCHKSDSFYILFIGLFNIFYEYILFQKIFVVSQSKKMYLSQIKLPTKIIFTLTNPTPSKFRSFYTIRILW